MCRLAVVCLVLATVACGTTEDPTVSSSSSPVSGGPITVTDTRGKEVRLDGPARRVAATEWNAAEHLVSLGVMPVGVTDTKGYAQWVSAEPLDDTVTDLGTRREPSMDTLAELDVGLVVVTDSLVEGALEQIEEDTPVVVLAGGDAEDSIGAMWRNVDILAKATGTEDRAASLRAEFDQKLADGRTAVAEAGAVGTKVAFSDSWVDSGTVHVRPYTKGALVTDVLTEIGFTNAWPMEGDPVYGLAQIDVEGLRVLDGDVRFWYLANDTFGDPYTKELAGNTIWTSLPFVKNGNVHRFPDKIGVYGGPGSMTQIIDAAVAEVR
jgi:iron complex transport system substrate-binding protein